MKTTGRMQRLQVGVIATVAGLMAVGLAGCGKGSGEVPRNKLLVEVTTGMVGDLVRQVGGGRVEVRQLMGPGIDPHLYKPTSADAARLGRADVIFYSGLNLEGRMGELFGRLAAAGRRAFAVTDSIPKELLQQPAGFEGHYDPHVWMDVSLWAKTIPTIVRGLSEADPEGKEAYAANGERVVSELARLHGWCLAQAATLPEKQRVLVTSHDAYHYFGRAYGFKVVGLQGVSTVSEAGLADVAGLVDFIRQQRVKAIFVESSVNQAAIRRVAEDSGVIVGGELFSDAMGMAGEIKDGYDVGSYEGMVKYNLATIIKALRQ